MSRQTSQSHPFRFLDWSTLLAALALSLANTCAAGTHPIANSTNCLVHPSLEISLFAAEPAVVDPVALTFDGAGRMYVVEMREKQPKDAIEPLKQLAQSGKQALGRFHAP